MNAFRPSLTRATSSLRHMCHSPMGAHSLVHRQSCSSTWRWARGLWPAGSAKLAMCSRTKKRPYWLSREMQPRSRKRLPAWWNLRSCENTWDEKLERLRFEATHGNITHSECSTLIDLGSKIMSSNQQSVNSSLPEEKLRAREQWGKDPCGAEYVREHELGTREFFDGVERHRYMEYAPWMPKVMEFGRFPGAKLLEIGCGMGT